VRTATIDDLAVVVETAARSLDAEAMLRWSFGEDRFEGRIRRHFTHYDGENIRHGWIRIAADGAGVAVWIPPEARKEHEAIPPAPAGDEGKILGGKAVEWAPEYEDARRLAKESGRELREVIRLVAEAARRT